MLLTDLLLLKHDHTSVLLTDAASHLVSATTIDINSEIAKMAVVLK